jgi:hypothetical protein
LPCSSLVPISPTSSTGKRDFRGHLKSYRSDESGERDLEIQELLHEITCQNDYIGHLEEKVAVLKNEKSLLEDEIKDLETHQIIDEAASKR